MIFNFWTKERLSLGILVVPFFGLWLIFWFVPLLLGIELSLKPTGFNENGFLSSGFEKENSKYVGLENFKRISQDPKFWKAIKNSFVYVGGSILIILPLSFVLALCLMKIERISRGILVFCLIIPSLALPGVLSTLFYLFFHGRSGALNQSLVIPLGMKPINWMMDPNFIMPTMILQSVWRWTGMVTLFFLCGLEAIPKWQREVAELEGAGTWMRVKNLWYPGIRHLAWFAGIFLVVDGFASFSGAYVLLGGSGGILDSGLLLVTYLYQVAFPGGLGSYDFPGAAAMSLMVAFFLGGALFLALRVKNLFSTK